MTLTTTKIETLAELKRRQLIFPEWMQKATAGLAPDAMVEVERRVTPFGTFVLAVRPARKA